MFSTSMRKCSAVGCIPALTRLPTELLSNVLPSALLVIGPPPLYCSTFYPASPLVHDSSVDAALVPKPDCSTGVRSFWPQRSRSARRHDYLSQFADAQDIGMFSERDPTIRHSGQRPSGGIPCFASFAAAWASIIIGNGQLATAATRKLPPRNQPGGSTSKPDMLKLAPMGQTPSQEPEVTELEFFGSLVEHLAGNGTELRRAPAPT